jgi:hypothetical protein
MVILTWQALKTCVFFLRGHLLLQEYHRLRLSLKYNVTQRAQLCWSRARYLGSSAFEKVHVIRPVLALGILPWVCLLHSLLRPDEPRLEHMLT